jgi:hypothetical protein
MLRFEKKFLFENSNDFSSNYLKFFFKKNNIVKLHKPNIIYNLYFDSLDLKNYYSHIDGNLDRYKVRVRWYSNTFQGANNFNLEIKRRINKKNIKYKISLPIKTTREFKNFNFNHYIKKINELYNFEKKHMIYKPILFNKYKRFYYMNKKKENRLTLDINLAFSKCFDFRPVFFKSVNLKLIEHKFTNNCPNPLNSSKNLILMSQSFSKYLFGLELLKFRL